MGEAAVFSMGNLIQEDLLLEFLKLVVILANNSYNDTGEESYRTYFC